MNSRFDTSSINKALGATIREIHWTDGTWIDGDKLRIVTDRGELIIQADHYIFVEGDTLAIEFIPFPEGPE